MIVCKCLADIDIFAVNTLPTCTGANHSYVSYDDIYHTMIDCICIPAGVLPCVCTREIVDDNCLNVSRHRPVLVNLVLPSIQTHDVVTNGTQGITSTGQYVETYTVMLHSDCDLVTVGKCSNPSVESIDQAYKILSVI